MYIISVNCLVISRQSERGDHAPLHGLDGTKSPRPVPAHQPPAAAVVVRNEHVRVTPKPPRVQGQGQQHVAEAPASMPEEKKAG